MTANAAKISEIIARSTEHLTAEGLHDRLKESGEKMSLATVYNSLNYLVSEGLVRKIPMDGEPDRYDKTIRHDHLICERCGAISDAMLDDYKDIFSKALGTSVEFYDLKLFWVCEKCRQKEQTQNQN